MIHQKYYELKEKQEQLLSKKNSPSEHYNGIYTRYQHPILTNQHIPIEWRFDLDENTNPLFLERLGVNATFNAGAIYFEGYYYLAVRVEGNDRKSFFALAQSDNGIDGFRFIDQPIFWENEADIDDLETNAYDMRLIAHEDGWIYGMYCAERKDPDAPAGDTSAATAAAAIVRTKDLKTWARLKDLQTPSLQQRNVTLHPEFVDGQYMLYTRPQDGFIDTGEGGGIAYGLCSNLEEAVIETEHLLHAKQYHTIYEVKNGQGPSPIKTDRGWIHIAHGVRNTAAGLRYVLYTFATSLEDPTKVIAVPSGHFIAPEGDERVGDVSNVVFSNGVVVNDQDEVFIYYASSDTRMHVATSTVERLVDYTFNTPSEKFYSHECVQQRKDLIQKNQMLLKQ